MQPKITRVKWSAVNIPWGVVFDELTGTFTGRPEDIGEYTIPVTVETNYGIDTKNVKMQVVSPTPTYGVYAIGYKAFNWSKNVSTNEYGKKNEYGFYRLNIPNVQKLVAHYNGFGALTVDHKYYFCGASGPARTASGEINKQTYFLAMQDVPRSFADFYSETVGGNNSIVSGVDRAITVRCTVTDNNTTGTGHVVIYWNSTLANYVACPSYMIKVNRKTGTSTCVSMPASLYKVSGVGKGNGETAFDESPYSAGIRCLKDNERGSMKKVFQYTDKFLYLSARGYLNDRPENFTHGIIKDAWVCYKTACVLTEDNELYQYEDQTKTWALLGTYDIKKIEISYQGSSKYHIFLLTMDGKLYHKGPAIKWSTDIVVADEHETLTHIFPELTFKDFTYGCTNGVTVIANAMLTSSNTLTVLMEE